MSQVLALFYINWITNKSAPGGDGNEGSSTKRPREECELMFYINWYNYSVIALAKQQLVMH